MIKPKTIVVLVPGSIIGGAVEGIGPNVGRASKQVRKGERFPRAKGKCDHEGITLPTLAGSTNTFTNSQEPHLADAVITTDSPLQVA